MKHLYITKKQIFGTDKYLATCNTYNVKEDILELINKGNRAIVKFDTFSEVSKKEAEAIKKSYDFPIEEMQNIFKSLGITTLIIFGLALVLVLVRFIINL